MELNEQKQKAVERLRRQANENAKKEAEKAERLENALKFKPRTADEYTDEEKVAAFDKLHAHALGNYNARRTDERTKDAQYYAYQALMQLLTPKGKHNKEFWDHYDELGELIGYNG